MLALVTVFIFWQMFFKNDVKDHVSTIPFIPAVSTSFIQQEVKKIKPKTHCTFTG
jgi:hypothetical protein